ncbi:hypothetical protein EDC04DRAFT_1927254 [Pisolithus marmoratus]|nr:hypothetical protein EDC04DRAFT_1927254 [Pisolithus marmoratus]
MRASTRYALSTVRHGLSAARLLGGRQLARGTPSNLPRRLPYTYFSAVRPVLCVPRAVFSQASVADSDRPDLFYHPISIPHSVDSSSSTPVYALSFLPTPPSSSRSATVIGWLPAIAKGTSGDIEAGLDDFVENPNFRSLMQETIQQGLREGVDEVWTNGALQLQHGWMHIHDSRNTPPLGRIGDPDDIIGSVLVEDSKILPDTYQAMPSYRLCTSDGPIQLTEGLARKLRTVLEDVALRETS